MSLPLRQFLEKAIDFTRVGLGDNTFLLFFPVFFALTCSSSLLERNYSFIFLYKLKNKQSFRLIKMTKITKIELFANKNITVTNCRQKNSINTKKYWKLLTAFALAHFFTQILRHADAYALPNHSRFPRHFPLDADLTSNDKIGTIKAETAAAPQGMFQTYIFSKSKSCMNDFMKMTKIFRGR